jgi:hypothetical protein
MNDRPVVVLETPRSFQNSIQSILNWTLATDGSAYFDRFVVERIQQLAATHLDVCFKCGKRHAEDGCLNDAN